MTDPAVSDLARCVTYINFRGLYRMQDLQAAEGERASHHHLSVVTLIAVAVVRKFRFLLHFV